MLAAIASVLLFGFASTIQAQGGPPLLTDDPGTPGNGMWEVNFLTTMERNRQGWAFQIPNVDLNYGLGNHIQLKFEAPWIITKDTGERPKTGLGNSMFGVKWRFLDEERHHLDMSIYPQVEFNNPTRSAARGLAEKGVQLFLPVEVAKSVGPVRLDGEIGYLIALDGADKWECGFVVARRVNSRVELMGELHGSALKTMRERELLLNVGSRVRLNKSSNLMFSVGRTIRSAEGEGPDYIAAFGIQFNFRHGFPGLSK